MAVYEKYVSEMMALCKTNGMNVTYSEAQNLLISGLEAMRDVLTELKNSNV